MATSRDNRASTQGKKLSSTALVNSSLQQAKADPKQASIRWVKGENIDSKEYRYFRAKPLVINAPLSTVSASVKNIERYNDFSHGAITAHVTGDVTPGSRIDFTLYKGTLKGAFIPKSQEMINVVDKDMIGWERILPWPFNAIPTERYQFLEELPNQQTRSHIALRVPGCIGLLTKFFMKGLIVDVFDALNSGVKVDAEAKTEKALLHFP